MPTASRPYPRNLVIADEIPDSCIWGLFRCLFLSEFAPLHKPEVLTPQQQKIWDAYANAGFIRQLLSDLDDRQRSLVILRFGLDGQPRNTVQDAAVQFNVNKHIIYQLEGKVLNFLRTKTLPVLIG